MRTIEEVVEELSDRLNGKHTDTVGNTVLCGYSKGRYNELLDEILEISKANESVKVDLISKSTLKD